MPWFYLLMAGLMEIGWPVGLKLAWADERFRWLPALFAVGCIVLSGFFLFLAQRHIPMGTAYAVWTGIGSVGAVVIGLLFFGEPATAIRLLCVTMIVAGIIGLKLCHDDKPAIQPRPVLLKE
jgi:quaternary ammonium compound-resistance protein SugE